MAIARPGTLLAARGKSQISKRKHVTSKMF
jgi:hypothetical protein